ncbi:MAG: glycosyltransferase family 2 protein [Tannerellaceae bacterium]|jgi:glycosyltransferase involved in cell wall biosynthesis|nr:glycosyltransferase family 2 protein [Tannerellaceae bacterium]
MDKNEWIALRDKKVSPSINASVSLIVTTYNSPDRLELTLCSVLSQTIMPREIIIADDGSTPDTAAIIQLCQSIFPVPIKHVWQSDKGFRLSLIRNKAIRQAEAPYIIQIDGDVVLEKHFIADHLHFRKAKHIIIASRMNYTARMTKRKLKTRNFQLSCFSLPFTFYPLFRNVRSKILANWFISKSRHRDMRWAAGSNMSYWKEDALLINGFDNDLVGWGYEDNDFIGRMKNQGIVTITIKHSCIQGHLRHIKNTREHLQHNKSVALGRQQRQVTWVENGYRESPQIE